MYYAAITPEETRLLSVEQKATILPNMENTGYEVNLKIVNYPVNISGDVIRKIVKDNYRWDRFALVCGSILRA